VTLFPFNLNHIRLQVQNLLPVIGLLLIIFVYIGGVPKSMSLSWVVVFESSNIAATGIFLFSWPSAIVWHGGLTV
jgi:hypothetical protein